MLNRISKSARTQCEHRNSVTVSNAGIKRTICESCGNVSFIANQELSGSVSRAQFERESEQHATTVG